MMFKTYLLIFFLFVAILAEEQPFKKIIHNTDPKAKCVDGSSPAIYLHQGNEPNNFIIFFVGGGACFGGNTDQVIESCYQRSKTDLGSSKNLKDEQFYNGGYLSTDPSRNKFASWTKVVIQYCDGAFHQGANEESIKYKDTELYFRGAYNTRSHFQYLVDNYNFKNAEKVVLTGSSAGGIASFLWNNYVRSLLVNPDALVAVPDSGVFTNVVSPVKGISVFDLILKNLFKLSNTDEKTPSPRCNSQFEGEEYKCFFIENIYSSLEGRILLVQSQYDSTLIPLGLNINCIQKVTIGHSLATCTPEEMGHIEAYRQSFLNFANKFLNFSENNNLWAISCSHHGYGFRGEFYDNEGQRVPSVTGLTLKEAV